MRWLLVLLVVFLYVHLFNRIATLYLDGGRRLTLEDLWTRWIPYRLVPVE